MKDDSTNQASNPDRAFSGEVQPVILAGGPSAPLWPLSRAAFPKELLTLNSGATLLQEAMARVNVLRTRGNREPNPPNDFGGSAINGAFIVCHEDHRHLVWDQVKTANGALRDIILEPASRGTAPAVTIAALVAGGAPEGQNESDPILLVMPADHVITDVDAWAEAMGHGLTLAAEGKMVAFGVVPGGPSTQFGYIRKGAKVGPAAEGFALEAFTEKPTADAAKSFLSAGKYFWNAGIFMIRTSIWLEAIAMANQDISAACTTAVADGTSDPPFFRVDAQSFLPSPNESIDQGVMERIVALGATHNWRSQDGGPITAAVVPLTAGWSDIGGWSSLLDVGPVDDAGNLTRGDVHTVNTRNSVVISSRRLVTTVGVENIVAVETPDAILVADRSRADEVPELVDALRDAHRDEVDSHARVFRPWGDYESLDHGERYQVKRLTVKPGEALSLQMHHHRAEHWVVVSGTAKVTRGEDEFLLTENESTYIPVGVTHRLENPGTVPVEIIEVQSGSYLGEDDIVRFEDRYDRGPET